MTVKNPYVDDNGTKKWFDNGKLHREDGPAVEYTTTGTKYWCKNGQLHRENGPAVIVECLVSSTFEESWYRYGKRHRLDGPAVMYRSGREYWFVEGKEIDIQPILESFDVSSDWRSWTDAEKMIMRLALP